MKKLLLIATALLATSVSANEREREGDILGRDLGGIPPLGHVALGHGYSMPGAVGTAYNALQVMNEEIVVQVIKIEDFRDKTKYWGAGYGLYEKYGNKKNQLSGSILKMMDAAERQRMYCNEYTFFADYKPGTHARCGKFRCDTFVYYAFKSGDMTFPTSLGITPNVVFHQYAPKKRAIEVSYVQLETPFDDKPALYITPNNNELVSYISMYKRNNKYSDLVDIQSIYQENGMTEELKEMFSEMILNDSTDKKHLVVALRGYLSTLTASEKIDNIDIINDTLLRLSDYARYQLITNLVYEDVNLASIYMPILRNILDSTDDFNTKDSFKVRVNYGLVDNGSDHVTEYFNDYIDYNHIAHSGFGK